MCRCDGAVGVHQFIAGVILGQEKEIVSISLAPDCWSCWHQGHVLDLAVCACPCLTWFVCFIT